LPVTPSAVNPHTKDPLSQDHPKSYAKISIIMSFFVSINRFSENSFLFLMAIREVSRYPLINIEGTNGTAALHKIGIRKRDQIKKDQIKKDFKYCRYFVRRKRTLVNHKAIIMD